MNHAVAITGLGIFLPGFNELEKLFAHLYRGHSLLNKVALDAGMSDLATDASPVQVICSSLTAADKALLAQQPLLAALAAEPIPITAKMALYAATAALSQAGFPLASKNGFKGLPSKRTGLFVGCNKNMPSLRALFSRWQQQTSPASVSAGHDISQDIAVTDQSAIARTLSQILHLPGPAMTFADACTAGASALTSALRRLQAGELDMAICGAAEQAAHPLMQLYFAKLGALSRVLNQPPASVCRPFDRERSGCLLADAAAFLVLERVESAKARGADILAYFSAASRQSEAYKMTSTASGGERYAHCMQQALANAHLQAHDIQHSNAHGTSTPLNDAAESQALAQTFYPPFYPEHSPPPTVTSTKSALGHSLAASGAVEAVLCVESLRQQRVLPTLNYAGPGQDEPHLSIVTAGRQQSMEHILSNSFGFGGENASVIFSRGNR